MRHAFRSMIATAILLFVAAPPTLAAHPMTASFAIPDSLIVGAAPADFRADVSNPTDGEPHPAVVIDLIVDPQGLAAPEDITLTLEPDGVPMTLPVPWTVQDDGTWTSRLSGPTPLDVQPGWVGGALFHVTVGGAALHGTIDVALVATELDSISLEPTAVLAEDHHAVQLHLSTEPSAHLAASSVQAGGSVTISVSGYQPFAEVTFTLHSEPIVLGTATADAAGSVTATFALPASVVGTHEVEARGLGLDGTPFSVVRELVVDIIPPPSSTADGPKPVTPAVPWLALGIGTVAAGALLRLLDAGARRRS